MYVVAAVEHATLPVEHSVGKRYAQQAKLQFTKKFCKVLRL